MLEAEVALSHTDWLAPEDGVLDILSWAHERTPMPGPSPVARACFVLYCEG